MRKCLGISICCLFLLCAGFAIGTEAPAVPEVGAVGQAGTRGEVPAPDGGVLWEQVLSTTTAAWITTNFFDPGNDGFDTYQGDDFFNDVPWIIDRIFLEGVLGNGGIDFTCAKSINIEIYADVNGTPDGFPGGPLPHPVWTTQIKPNHSAVTLTTGVTGGLSNITVDLDVPISLPPGRWWLVAYGTMEWAVCGTWHWHVSDTTNGFDAVGINPLGGLGLATVWTPITDPAMFSSVQSDVAFRLEGAVGTGKHGVDVLVSQGHPVSGVVEYFYGGSVWPELTATLDATANSVTVIPDLSDLGFMMTFDSLWVDQRGEDGQPNSFLTATEEANIAAFAATGKPVVIIGENSSAWPSWNAQIMGVLGGSVGADTSGPALPLLAYHPLTWKVHEIDIPFGGGADGGPPLFDQSVATLFGPEQNALALMDVNLPGEFWGDADNATFMGDVVSWLACERPFFGHGFELGNTNGWGAGSNVECAHDICDEGGPLGPLCDPCVAQICAVDPFCCDVGWDGICVGQVDTVCGISCP